MTFAAGAASATVVLRDNDNLPPVIALTSPANGTLAHTPANVTLLATAADTSRFVAGVEFFANATNRLGASATAPHAFVWTNAPAGAHALTAVATDSFGAGATSAVVNLLVNARPVIALTSPANHAAFTALATVPLVASAGDADGTVAAVEFYEGVSRLATVTSAPYIFIWSGVATGSYTLTARVTDDRGAVASTPPAAITVGPTAFVDSFADRATMNGFTNFLTGNNAAFTKLVAVLNALAEDHDMPVIVSTHPRTRNRIDALDVRFHAQVRLLKPLGVEAP